MKKLNALVLDIETAPITAYVWGRHDQNIAINQIKVDWHVIGWAAKWLSEPTVIYHDQRNHRDLTDDRDILKPLWHLLDSADILITQNGKAFDAKKLNARFILHGWNPPSPYKHLDTYLIAKNAGAFTANSLEYLSEKLCKKYKKLKHAKFPGMELWNECLKGNLAAWNEMQKYNIHDVLATEELYGKLKAWAPDNAPEVYEAKPDVNCGVCGAHAERNGYVVVKGGRKPRYHCQSPLCGRWTLGKKLKEAA